MERIARMFPTWESYIAAFSESMDTEMFYEKYPEYSQLHDDLENSDGFIILSLLQTGYNPQTGLELFIEACATHTRYIGELSDFIVDPFIKYGAKVTPEMVDRLLSIPDAMKDDVETGLDLAYAQGITLGFLRRYGGYCDFYDVEYVRSTEDIPLDLDPKIQVRMAIKSGYERYRTKTDSYETH